MYFAYTHVDQDDDSFDVLSAINDCAGKYFFLGLALGLKHSDLEVMKQDNPMNSRDALPDVVSFWLKQNYNTEEHGKPSWRVLYSWCSSPSYWWE